MAENKTWKRIEETLGRIHLLSWLLEIIFPGGSKGVAVTSIVGVVGLLLGWLRRANFANAWLYFVGAIALYGFGWACVHLVRWMIETGPPATIKFTAYELYKSPEANQRTSIFLRVKIELSGLKRVAVTHYRMELSRAGVLNAPEFRDDVHAFEITDWSRMPIPHDDLRPLPMELISGNQIEGWVHFVTDCIDSQLYLSHVRLFADTSKGSGSLEISPGREYWNVVPNRMILPKNLGST